MPGQLAPHAALGGVHSTGYFVGRVKLPPLTAPCQLISLARNWITGVATYWHVLIYPGAALLLFVLGWNLIGDAFRDALDPKMRGPRSQLRAGPAAGSPAQSSCKSGRTY